MPERRRVARPSDLPSLREWEFGNRLRSAREEKNLRNKEVAAYLGVTPSAVTKWENGTRRPSVAELLALCAKYGLNSETTDELRRWLEEPNAQGHWQSSNIEADTKYYLSLEERASAIRSFEITVMPGMLQARDYATAVIGLVRPKFSPERIAANVDARMARRRVLEGNTPASLHTVIDEGVLYREFGGRPAMRDQLQSLLDFSAHPNVEIQILRFTAPASEAQDGSFTLLDIPSLPSHAYAEGQLGQIFQHDAREFARCQEAFARISRLAETTEQTVELIKRRLAEINES